MVSVFEPYGTEKYYDHFMIGKIRKAHSKDSAKLKSRYNQDKKNRDYFDQGAEPITTQKLLFLHASNIMSSPVVTLPLEADPQEAYDIFSLKRFRHIPIMKEGMLVGILSDRDFLRETRNSAIRDLKDIMTENVLSVKESTEVHLLAKVLFEERIGALPIIDSDKNLVGIVTRSDILRALSRTEIFNVHS